MILAGQILFGMSVALGIAVVVALGRPTRYPDRGVAWYLSATAWSALLIDGLFFLALLGMAVGMWASYLLLVFVGLRNSVSGWLLWMILRAKRRS